MKIDYRIPNWLVWIIFIILLCINGILAVLWLFFTITFKRDKKEDKTKSPTKTLKGFYLS